MTRQFFLSKLLLHLVLVKALIDSYLTPDLPQGPQHSSFADLSSMFNVSAKMVHPVIIPTSSLCQSEGSGPTEALSLNLL